MTVALLGGSYRHLLRGHRGMFHDHYTDDTYRDRHTDTLFI